jgi:DNA recombination protein RmuC
MVYFLFFIGGVILGAAVLLPFFTSARAARNLLQSQLVDLQNATTAQSQSEGKILEKLAPVSDTINQMRTKIESLEKERHSQYGALSESLKVTMSQQEDLRKATAGLATALKSNQSRGQWGEAQLRRIVEATGMVEHVSFDMQVAGSSTRPDMVIHLPEGKTIVVDAKAPAYHYLEACAISDYGDEAELRRKSELMTEHAKAVRLQIDLLSKKEYWAEFESPDFTIMFIPNEAMLSAALETDPTLLEHSFQKRIALASPVSLFSVLKTVSFVWQQQLLSDNARELGELSMELLKRVGVVARHGADLAGSLEKAVGKYNDFAKSLEGNVITQANKIAKHMEKPTLDAPKKLEFKAHEWKKGELTEV